MTLNGVTGEVVSEVVFRSWNIAWFEPGESECSTGRDAAEMKGTKEASDTVKSIVDSFRVSMLKFFFKETMYMSYKNLCSAV